MTVAPEPRGWESWAGVTLHLGLGQVAQVERRRRRGVARGGADAQHVVDALDLYGVVQEGDGGGHPPVLEARRGIEPVVLHEERGAHPGAQLGVGPDHGGLPLAQVDDVVQGNDGQDELVEAEYARELGQVGVFPRIEDFFPSGGGNFPVCLEIQVLYLEQRAAHGAGVDEVVDVVLGPASDAGIHQAPLNSRHVCICHFRLAAVSPVSKK